MNKPFSIAYKEFKDGLANLINNSNMPPFIIESVLQNCLYEISEVVKNQYKIDATQYEKAILENAEKDKKSD